MTLINWFWRGVAWPVGTYLWLSALLTLSTSRISREGPGASYSGPAVYVNWHGFLPFLMMMHGRDHRWVMMSPAPYMESIARYAEFLGMRLVRGATGDRGREALAILVEKLHQGESVFLAVDGPAGPARKVKRGCVDLARAGGVPIIPLAYQNGRGKFHPTRWDRWLSAPPFDRIRVVFGEPITIAEGEDNASALARVTAGLEAVSPLPS